MISRYSFRNLEKIIKMSTKSDSKNKTKPEKVTVQAESLKILMLHGYRQNEMAFRERSGGLRKALKNYAEFIFCEAPHIVPKSAAQNENSSEQSESTDENPNNTNNQQLEERGWWFSSKDSSYDALERTDCQKGFEETLDYLNNIFETKGPFDGIFGFSQGACLSSILCRICSNNRKSALTKNYKFIDFKFAILVAGFKSQQINHEIFYDINDKLDIPTLHVIGNGDKVIPSEMALKLTDYFLNPKIFTHQLGHFIPVNAESKQSFIEFLNEMRKNFKN